MPYANSRRIITVASIPVSPSTVVNVTIFSPSVPETRENGGDLLNGDRWIDTESYIESIYYNNTWNYITNPNFEDNGIDGGGAIEIDAILDLGGAVVDPLETIYSGGDAFGN